MKALFAPVVSAIDWEGRGTPALLLATGGFGLRLNRLDRRALRLYWFFQALDARCQKLASNEPGGVATLPRHFFIARFRTPANE